MTQQEFPWRPLPSLDAIGDAAAIGATVHIAQASGAELHAVSVGSGRPLVFMHALGWDHRQWRRELTRYGQRYRAIAGDTRGHGRSAMPPGPYSMGAFRDDWLALLDRLGVERACLVGFSLGGMIAQHIATTTPERVAALVLVSTVCRFAPEARAAMEQRIEINRRDGPLMAAQAVAKGLFSEEFRNAEPAFLQEFYRWRLTLPQEPLFDSIRATCQHDICEAVSALAMPCMVIAGERDVATPPDNVRELARRIPGAELHVVSGAGHMLPIERPQAFLTLLDGFLARHYAVST